MVIHRCPSLLLWPPGSSTVRVWDHLIHRTGAARFHVVRIDVYVVMVDSEPDQSGRGAIHIRSVRTRRDGSFLSSFNIESTHVWSQSWGTRAAIVFCARNQIVRKVRGTIRSQSRFAGCRGATSRHQRRSRRTEITLGISLRHLRLPDSTNIVIRELHNSRLVRFEKSELVDVIDELTMPVLIGTGSHDPNLTSSRVNRHSSRQRTCSSNSSMSDTMRFSSTLR